MSDFIKIIPVVIDKIDYPCEENYDQKFFHSAFSLINRLCLKALNIYSKAIGMPIFFNDLFFTERTISSFQLNILTYVFLPVMKNKSIKIILPMSRRVSTQPETQTSLPSILIVSSIVFLIFNLIHYLYFFNIL